VECILSESGAAGLFSDRLLLISRSGKEIPIEEKGAPIIREDGTVIGTVLVFRDQTEERKIQKALMESENRYRLLLESAPVGIAVLSENLITYINPAGAHLLGADSSGKITGKNINSIIHPLSLIDCHERLQQLIEGEKALYPVEYVFMQMDGTMLDVEVMATQLGQKGLPVIQLIFVDITQRKKAENEIKRLNADLESRIEERTAQLTETNKDLEAYSYSISHDLRAPLRAIDGFARFLMEDYSNMLDEHGIGIVELIRQNSKRMGQLIDDLLKFSKLSNTQIKFSKVPMNTIVHEVYRELTETTSGRIINFHCDNLADAIGDESMIRQVWTNLISNSIKYSSGRDCAKIYVTSSIKNDMIVYSIQDNGVGFNMQYYDKLFEVFRRLHSIREFEGTGVGLAIVKRVIQRQGGKVWAEGEPDKGAKFYFSLPSS
jgi:PAS domain S-box-containing protein